MLVDFSNITNLKQYNSVSNNNQKILDLVFSDLSKCNVSSAGCSLSVIDPQHPPLDIEISYEYPNTLRNNLGNRIINYYKADYASITKDLSEKKWDQIFSECTDVNEMLNKLYDILRELISQYIPFSNLRKGKYPPWFNKALIKLLREKNNLRKRFKKYKNPMDQIEFRLLDTRCEKFAAKLYTSYVELIEQNIVKNPKYFWSYIKSKRDESSSYPPIMTDGETDKADGSDICDLFADTFAKSYSDGTPNGQYNTLANDYLRSLTHYSLCFGNFTIPHDLILKKLKSLDTNKGAGPDGIPPIFVKRCADSLVSPLYHIINKSLSSGIFPHEWKLAKVVPIYKSGDKTFVQNYRPISILSTMAKVFEAVVCPFIQNHFQLYITDHQHGFVKARSTYTNLVTFVEGLAESMDKHKEVDVIYTDFSKAFDKVAHSILINKLSVYGFSGNVIDWIKSYLSGRFYYVVVKGYQSKLHGITSGVPQGSHLGPTLFNIFINDLPSCFLASTPFLFADDLKISREVSSELDVSMLQQDLDILYRWCCVNGMILNADKCFYIKFTRKHNIIRSSYNIGGRRLHEVDTIRDLGVILDKKLTYVPHIENIVKRASNMLGFIMRNGKIFKNKHTRTLLYNTLVRSVLEYCPVVWRPHYATHTLRIERVQKRFMRHLCYVSKLDKRKMSYSEKLDHFKIPSLEKRRKILDLIFLYKVLNNHIDCPQLVKQLRFRVPRGIPRRIVSLLVPPSRTTVYGSNSPIPRLCRLLNEWFNSGPKDIFSIKLHNFRKHLLQIMPN